MQSTWAHPSYLNHLVFDSFAEAEAYIASAFMDDNHEKPQHRLGWKTPAECRASFPSSASSVVTENAK